MVELVKKKPKRSLDDALGKAEKKTSKTKSKVPVLDVDEDTRKLIASFRENVAKEDSIHSEVANQKDDIKGRITPIWESMSKHGFLSSVRVPDINGDTITLHFKHKYSDIPVENQETLQETFGDNYDNMIERKLSVSVAITTEDALSDLILTLGYGYATINRIQVADEDEAWELGQEVFSKTMEVKRALYPTQNYTNSFVNLDQDTRTRLYGIIGKDGMPQIAISTK